MDTATEKPVAVFCIYDKKGRHFIMPTFWFIKSSKPINLNIMLKGNVEI